jgi:serine/threonine protein kinase
VQTDSQIGQYNLLGQIGEGGMGAVWLGEHVALGRLAAIKVLHPEFSRKREYVKRFFNEARAAAAISDPGIVQIFDFGQHVDGSAYIVMERLEGEGLDQRLEHSGRLAVHEALRIVRQVASTLATAHAAGIVHRDLKPGNIFLVRDPEVAGGERAKVLDFGIAKLTDDSAGVKTKSWAVLGTPKYMAPEQCRGAGFVDARSDVYSLGCVLFTLITGAPPFDAEGFGDVIAMQLREPAPAPSTRVDGISPAIDDIVLTCLAKDPAARYASAHDLATAIDELLGTASQQTLYSASRRADSVVPKTVELTTLGGASRAIDSTRLTPRVWPFAIAATATLCVAGGTIVWLTHRSAGDDTNAHTPSPTTPSRTAAAPAKPDAAKVTGDRIAAVMKSLGDWATAHPHAVCPMLDDLGTADARADGWGHTLVISCDDHSGVRMATVRSAGPDGVAGTSDDVLSSSLGLAAISIGAIAPPSPNPSPTITTPSPHVASKRVATPTKRAAPARVSPAPVAPAPATPSEPLHPVPPTYQLDADGVPVSR